MKRRKKPISANLLRLFLVLWILASLGYWIAGIVDLWDTRVHWDQRVAIPFQFDSDSRLVHKTGLRPEAGAAGLAAGDRIEALNGAPYSGTAQWATVLSESHPGDILDVDVTRPGGSHATLTLTLARTPYLYGRLSPLWAFWQGFLLVGLLTLVCLLIGYWVVLTRPADRNAWLLLVLLTFPSVVFINPGLASGLALALRGFWYQTLQLAGAPALLLFGIYFPERSRIDARARWIKWLLLALYGISVLFLYPPSTWKTTAEATGRFSPAPATSPAPSSTHSTSSASFSISFSPSISCVPPPLKTPAAVSASSPPA
jgi:sigma-B regulation protein RsbU (phosphoserine phosphatase)